MITPGQPSSNPRLVKEALALRDAGFKVTVLYSFWVDWADEMDKQLFIDNPDINWTLVGGHPRTQPLLFAITRLNYKFSRYVSQCLPSSAYWQERAMTRTGLALGRKARTLPAVLYIAHYLGALGPACRAARKHLTKYSFDAEDFHRGQVQEGSLAYKRDVLLEDRFLPGVSGCTAASPMIADKYRQLYPLLEPAIIHNVFSRRYLQTEPPPYRSGEILKLFWFSQTVGSGRGLEELIISMGKVKGHHLSCTILGSCTAAMELELRTLAVDAGLKKEQLCFLQPIDLAGIFRIASTHHIGMALEIATTVNRQICLTNKLFTYPLAALAVIATDTPAQKQFIEKYPAIGTTYPVGDPTALATILQGYADRPEEMNQARLNAWKLAGTTLNWEAEQQVFLGHVSRIVGKN